MPRTCRSNRALSALSHIRGTARLLVDAAEATTDAVEKMHRTIQRQPAPFGTAKDERTRGLTGFVYRSVRGGIRLVGEAVDAGLAAVPDALREGNPSPREDAFRSIANGVCGDYLARTENPLAIEMGFRLGGERVDLHDLRSAEPRKDIASSSKLLILVHGLCMNDRQWRRDGHDHGVLLGEALGYAPLYLQYNSGLAIANNGRTFAGLLERLVTCWGRPIDNLVIVGYSMGGLVARSACYYGQAAGHRWTERLSKLVFLGTPHHGAPLERRGHGLELLMQLSPYSLPIAGLSAARSAGIVNLRHGTVSPDERVVPLPPDVHCYAAAAVRASGPGSASERVVGDGLVPVDSALGRHTDPAMALGIAEENQWIGYGMGHLDLLNHADAYRQLKAWLS